MAAYRVLRIVTLVVLLFWLVSLGFIGIVYVLRYLGEASVASSIMMGSANVLVVATMLLVPLAIVTGILFLLGRGKSARKSESDVASSGPTQPPPDRKESYTLSAIGSGLAIFGLALFGGLYLEVPGLALAVAGRLTGEKRAGKAIVVCVICILLQVILMFGLTLLRIFTYR